MTDARLKSWMLTSMQIEELSDRAYRTFTFSLLWSNEQGSDGRLPARAMKFLHPDGVDAATRAELVAAGLWVEDGLDAQIPGWSTTMGQSMAEDVERQRESNRQRQAKSRAKRKSDVTRDVTRESQGVTHTRESPGHDSDRTRHDSDSDSDSAPAGISWTTAIPGEPARDFVGEPF